MFTDIQLFDSRQWSDAGLSAVSGLLWGLAGAGLSAGVLGGRVWGGVIAAPLIGVAIGALFLPLWDKPRWVQVLASLLSLYLAAAMFAVGTAIADLVVYAPSAARPDAVVIQHVLGVAWGLTFLGLVLPFWALSYVNHRAIWRRGL